MQKSITELLKSPIVTVFILRWAYCWAELLDALIGIFTLGLILPTYKLTMAKVLAKYRYHNLK